MPIAQAKRPKGMVSASQHGSTRPPSALSQLTQGLLLSPIGRPNTEHSRPMSFRGQTGFSISPNLRDVTGLTYDAGALVAADRSERRLWALHKRALERGLVPTVPAGVLAQGWRGGPQAQLSRLLKGCRVEHLNESRARAAGTACGVAGTSDVVDATVVVGAAARGDVAITSDPADLAHLADALGLTLLVERI